ncbi:MAG: hypothetical protein VXY26_03440 [Bacteroidota bacterium]|nr:hypothetical protein [Bacteroidota bacterium]
MTLYSCSLDCKLGQKKFEDTEQKNVHKKNNFKERKFSEITFEISIFSFVEF